MIRHSKNHILPESGATIVEFAFIVVIVFGLIGAIIDFGLHVYRFNLVTHVVKQSVRVAAKYSVVEPDCTNIETRAVATAKSFAGVDGVRFVAETPSESAIELTASRNLDCFFICQFLPTNIEFTTSSQVTLETNRPCQRQPIS